jgi:hypothetical protein
MIGPTNQGVNDLIDADTAAHGGNESYWYDPDVDDMQGQDVVGYLTNCPGDDIGGPTIPGPNSFIPIVRLVR